MSATGYGRIPGYEKKGKLISVTLPRIPVSADIYERLMAALLAVKR